MNSLVTVLYLMIDDHEFACYVSVPIVEACCREGHDASPAGAAYGASCNDADLTNKAYGTSDNHAVSTSEAYNPA